LKATTTIAELISTITKFYLLSLTCFGLKCNRSRTARKDVEAGASS